MTKPSLEDIEDGLRAVDALVLSADAKARKACAEDLRNVRVAALEGAKVPGLVADNAALVQAGRRWVEDESDEDDSIEALVAVLRAERPGAAMLAEHAREVSALQARVAELEAKVRNLRIDRDAGKGFLEAAESERDTLRAQVASYLAALDARQAFGGGGGGLRGAARERTLAKRQSELIEARKALRAALSAPPAETTPATERAESQCACGRPLRHCDGSQSGCFLGR